jgi:hypothetical protein
MFNCIEEIEKTRNVKRTSKKIMIEVKATNTKQKFICSSKDKIMDNGNCYQLVTQSFRKDWCNLTPVISKTEFNRLMKMGVLGEPYKQKRTIEVTMYNFIVD